MNLRNKESKSLRIDILSKMGSKFLRLKILNLKKRGNRYGEKTVKYSTIIRRWKLIFIKHKQTVTSLSGPGFSMRAWDFDLHLISRRLSCLSILMQQTQKTRVH